jgi:hypothetical protein
MTKSTKKIFREADIFPANQEIPYSVWNLNFQYHVSEPATYSCAAPDQSTPHPPIHPLKDTF